MLVCIHIRERACESQHVRVCVCALTRKKDGMIKRQIETISPYNFLLSVLIQIM